MEIYLDIETTSLDADHGPIVAIGLLKNENIDVRFASNTDEEKAIIEWLENEINGDTIVTWYGSGFDEPFLVARAAMMGINLSNFVKAPKLDLCEWSKEHLKLSKHGLESVAKFFGLSRKINYRGSDVPALYRLASSGDEKSKKLIIEHCTDDLRLLRAIHDKLKPYIM